MFTITIKLENLSEKGGKYLEKEFAKLEKYTKKSREFHFEEALIYYMWDMEWDIRKHEMGENKKKDRDEWRKEEIKRCKKAEKINKEIRNRKPYNYHIVEMLLGYLEDIEDMRSAEKIMWEEKKGKKLTEKEVDKEIKKWFGKREKKRLKDWYK